MSKMLNVRIDDKTAGDVEAVRDPQRFPTQSDFVREAIRRMVREERRNRVRDEVRKLAQDGEYMAEMAELANQRLGDLAERWKKADRGAI